jgi:alkylated DNA repair protein alkB family protein 8
MIDKMLLMDQKLAEKLIQINQETYNDIAKDFSNTRKHLWPELETFAHYIKDKQKIIDLGCGNGRLLKLINNKQVDYTGIDYSKKLIEIAKNKYPNQRFKVDNILNLSLDNNTYDLGLSIAVLHHIPPGEKQEKAVKEMSRVLKPKAKAIVSVWNLTNKKFSSKETIDKKNVLINWGQDGRHQRYYYIFDKDEFKTIFSNFKIIEEKYTKYNFWLVIKNI